MNGLGTPRENDDDVSGLDLAPAMKWYGQNEEILTEMLAKTRMCGGNMPVIENGQHLQMQRLLGEMLIMSFPREAQERAIPGTIKVCPSKWFNKDSTSKDPKATDNIDEAISPTAIIPSYVDYSSETGKPWVSNIELYKIPDSVNPAVAQIVQAQGLVHEYAHTVADAFLYGHRNLLFKDEREFNSVGFIDEFIRLTETISPMSSYSGSYRNRDWKYPEVIEGDKDSRKAFFMALREELAECIAAHILGFVYTEDEDRRMDPFKGREELKAFIDEFLNAKLKDSSVDA
ncbi:MAG: hypothetical protein WC269_01490 [Candidatus Gracilibacteria bacterium]|jgi:hypothetical protein